MMSKARTAILLAVLQLAHAQLRPRRVGTGALGGQEQEVTLTDVPTGGGNLGAAANAAAGAGGMGMEQLAEMMQKGMMDPDLMAKAMDMENNPMLKGLASANPQLAQQMQEMMSDPSKMAEQMQQAMKLMATPEGQEQMGGLMKNMMSEMKNVMSDPEKLKAGIEQVRDNPMMQNLAEAVPGLQQLLDDPEQLAEQASKMAEALGSLGEGEGAEGLGGMGELLKGLTGEGGGDPAEAMAQVQQMVSGMLGGEGGAEMSEAMQKVAALMNNGGVGGDDLGGLLNGMGGGMGEGDDDLLGAGDGDLKARVRAKMAEMMNKRRGGDEMGIDEEEF